MDFNVKTLYQTVHGVILKSARKIFEIFILCVIQTFLKKAVDQTKKYAIWDSAHISHDIVTTWWPSILVLNKKQDHVYECQTKKAYSVTNPQFVDK
jgi:hypothetical protein